MIIVFAGQHIHLLLFVSDITMITLHNFSDMKHYMLTILLVLLVYTKAKQFKLLFINSFYNYHINILYYYLLKYFITIH